MPRPRRFRRVMQEPGVDYFKPAGVRLSELDEQVLTVDEYEAVRLKDFEGLEQSKAAEKMGISQPTFHRLLLSARKKLTDAIVNGKAIRIKGGNYKMVQKGRGAGQGRGRGLGIGPRGRQKGSAAGPGGECVCPDCGHRAKHIRGKPCNAIRCAKCGTAMTR